MFFFFLKVIATFLKSRHFKWFIYIYKKKILILFSTLMVEGSKEAGAITAVEQSLLDLHLSPCEGSAAREALRTGQ